jgi:outer membrane protein TolC
MRSNRCFTSRHPALRAGAIFIGALLTSACQTLSPDGGMVMVSGFAARELKKDVVAIRTPGQAEEVRAHVARLLRRPLTADSAVQIALLNNRGLQAAYNELGLAEAAMVQASLPPNPTLTVERLSSFAEIEIERRIIANVLALVTLPARSAIAADRFRQAQLRAAEETLRLAAQARRAYYRAVAARAAVAFLEQAQSAAGTATQLARRLGETGAMTKLDQAREQVFYAELTGQLAGARQRAGGEREKLVRVLGLWGRELAFKLPNALPALPRRAKSLPGIEVEAVARRIDVQIARIEIEALAKSYGLSQATRFVNLLELSGIHKTVKERESGERVRSKGFELELQIPLFDFGGVRVRQAEETYLQAVNRLAEKAVNARSQAREAYHAYRSSYDIARHYQREVLPLRKIISEETLLRYNSMLIDVFALLAEARQRVAANVAAIEAQRGFWLAAVDVGAAVMGGGTTGASSEASPMMAAADSGDAGH